jgi:hypothetical protein
MELPTLLEVSAGKSMELPTLLEVSAGGSMELSTLRKVSVSEAMELSALRTTKKIALRNMSAGLKSFIGKKLMEAPERFTFLRGGSTAREM